LAVRCRYGILAKAESKAAFWSGADWAEYPVRAYARSMKAFDTERATLVWARSQPDGYPAVMKFAASRADAETAARKLIEIAHSVEAIQDDRIFIELSNGPFLFELKATPGEYIAGLNLAIERGFGSRCMRAGLTRSSPRLARICSRKASRQPVAT
jgi:hypothetical protein